MSTVTERVTTAVETLAVRLADPVRCRAVATDPGNTDPFREMTPWEPMGLAHGYPGAALFWAELAREDPAAGPPDASAVLPFDFSRLVFVTILGYVFFAERPGPWTWMGAGVIVAASAYIAHREAVLGRQIAPPHPP